MKKSGDYNIPFDPKTGDLHDYPVLYPNNHPSNSVWFDNYEFTDTLTLVDWSRGRSSVKFNMRRESGQIVSFFVKDFSDVVTSKDIFCGRVRGTFTFTKKGQNYGCKLVKP